MFYKYQLIWFLGHTSNKLLLALMSIGYKSKFHLLKMGFSLLLAQLLHQWVSHVVYGVDSLHFDISFLEVIADEVESLFDVLRFLMRPWLLI